MKNNIYDYLNNVKTDYDEVKLSELEIERLKRFAIKNSKKKKHFINRKFVGLAATFLLAFGTILGTNENVRAEVFSYVEKFFTNVQVPLNEAKGVPEEVQKYVVNLHETVQLKNISFVVEDVAIDGKNGYVNIIYPEEYSYENSKNIYTVSKVYIDGIPYTAQTSGSKPTKIENGLISEMVDFSLSEPMPNDKDLDLTIVFSNFNDSDDSAGVKLNISMAELNKDSKIYLSNFKIPGNPEYEISFMKINYLNPRIEMLEPKPAGNPNNFTTIIGLTDEGKRIVFSLSLGLTVNNKFETVYEFQPKDENSNEITSDLSTEDLNSLKGDVKFQIYKTYYEKDENGKHINHIKNTIGDSFIVNFD